jgi:hypothetical protein
MRKLALTIFALAALATAYVAYPFVTAWTIREAIQSGNTAYLQDKIEWDGVRASLRQSLSSIAADDEQVDSGDEPAPKPGLWKRLKMGMKQRAVNGLVENYVTPKGLPQLFEYRQMYREHVSGEPDQPPWPARLANFWSRIKRAEFHTPTAVEFEMADRNDPNRHYIGLLRLRGLEWKLSELTVRIVDPEDAPAPAGEEETSSPEDDVAGAS